MLENIMGKVDSLLIGGSMAATFLKAKSYEIGLSLIEADRLETAARLLGQAAKSGVHLLLPVDVVVADELDADAEVEIVSIEKIPKDKKIVDIGPKTITNFSTELRGCKTIFWNGPVGINEIPRFAKGTLDMAKLLADLDATTIIGGGSTAEVVNEIGLADNMTFVSTGGGAALRFLGGETLPGVETLMDKGPGVD
jgi:phosphoglycerate kinase